MRRFRVSLALVFIGVILGAGRGWGELAPLIRVSTLIHDSSIIVVGEVTGVQESTLEGTDPKEGSAPAKLFRATIRVERVLKGTAEGELLITHVVRNNAGPREIYVRNGDFGLFFIRESDQGLTFASPYRPKVIALREDCQTKGEPTDRVAGELACIIGSPTSAVFDRISALSALADVPEQSATEVLRRAARDLPRPLNYLAAIHLAARNDISMLPLVEEAALTSPLLDISDQGNHMEYHWGRELEGIKDSAAIPVLSRLLSVDDSEVRQGAVEAFRKTGSDAAIEPLARALDDPDFWVRWKAVMALATITHQQDWYPAYDGFKENQQLYLDYWKSWTRQRPSRTP